MIELGRIIIRDETSIVEARNKIRLLAADIKFDSMNATRLATITSDLSRIIYQKGEESSIGIAFDRKDEAFGLVLSFQSKKEELDIGKAEIFFDSLHILRTKNGFKKIVACKTIPDPGFKPTEEFINIEKERLIRFSRAELFNEVKKKNEELGKLLDELNKHREHLEELVEKRTSELEEKSGELELANLSLLEADQHKSVFIANMSHELRTPLNSIIGFTDLVLEGISGEINQEQRKQLSMVERSGNHLLNLINDILDVSKVEAGKVELSIGEFSLNDLVKDLVKTLLPQASEKGLEFLTDVPGGITLLGDKRRLEQVLLNLAGNAVKFTAKGSIKVAANILDGGKVEIRVIDTGIGIKKKDMNKLFTPFQQVDMSSTKRYEGTGLGLHLSRKLANLMGGDISVKSEYGRGSEFVLTIPIKYKLQEQFANRPQEAD